MKLWDIVEYHRLDVAFPQYEGDLGIVTDIEQSGELGRNIPS